MTSWHHCCRKKFHRTSTWHVSTTRETAVGRLAVSRWFRRNKAEYRGHSGREKTEILCARRPATLPLTVALLVQCCVRLQCRLWPYVLWLNGESWSKSYYWEPLGSRIWEIDWYQNEWLWPLLRGHVNHCVTFDVEHLVRPLEIEVLFQRTTNRKWHMAYRMVTWPMTSRDLERSNSWPQYA